VKVRQRRSNKEELEKGFHHETHFALHCIASNHHYNHNHKKRIFFDKASQQQHCTSNCSTSQHASTITTNSMSSQFIQKIINHVANEIIIKGLANSRTFQRFVVRTDATYQEYAKQGTETLEQLTKTAMESAEKAAAEASSSSAAKAAAGPPTPPLRGMPGFFSAFAKEVRKDVTGQ
jgi:hypothetical protein